MKLSVSILSSPSKEESTKMVNNTTADLLHIDVQDRTFTKNKSFSIKEINKLSKMSKKNLDVHLMVKKPHKYIKKLNLNNISYISFHIEIGNKKYINKLINLTKEKKIKVGLVINPETSINEIKEYLDIIDMVLVMTVNPGYGGQELITSVIPKIKLIKDLNKDVLIEVDGGINNENISKLKEADIFVIGSYITNSLNYEEKIRTIKNSI